MSKIVIIGGGSYTWGPTFLRDIFATPKLKGSTIVLEDIARDRVDLVYALGKKMIDDFNLDFQLETTLSLEEALPDADFVILTITTGRLESMRPDLEIPVNYGIKQSVGDTTGPGGLSRALRNIPVVVDIAQKVNESCPNAFFLNYTNPMTVLTRAICMTRSVSKRTVGLCHEYIGVRENLAKLYSVRPEDIQSKVAGVNHLIWITDLWANGKHIWDELPALTDKVLNDEIQVDSDDATVFADHFKVKSTLFKLYGALPAAGDRHIAEFFPHFINKSTSWGADYDIRLTSIQDRQGLEMLAKAMIESVLNGETDLKPFMANSSTEAANKIIHAVTCGEQYTGIMNLPNVGQVGNLPYNAVIETFGVIDQTGTSAITNGDVPAGVRNILEHHIRQQEMTIESAQSGSRDLALQVLLNDPLSTRLTISQAKQMLDELLEANKKYLPKFFNLKS
jgi:alpha-galactosidase